jgi:hypothetical protein
MRVSFQGYAGDCTIGGEIDISGARLSDALDQMDEVAVHDAILTSLGDGRVMHAGELVLRRDDLFAIEGHGGPPADERRRVRTVRHVLRVELGPYTCFGEVHALPGVAPLRTLLVRRTMVPLTNCVVHFRRADRDEVRRMPLLILNGRKIDRAEEATTEELESDRGDDLLSAHRDEVDPSAVDRLLA